MSMVGNDKEKVVNAHRGGLYSVRTNASDAHRATEIDLKSKIFQKVRNRTISIPQCHYVSQHTYTMYKYLFILQTHVEHVGKYDYSAENESGDKELSREK